MTNKEILAELKVCYELMTDIYDNEEERFDKEEMQKIWNIKEQIDDLYFRLWNTTFTNGDKEDEKDFIIEENDEEVIMIGQSASADYSIQNKASGEFDEDIITCGDLGKYWYWETLGLKHNDYDYKVVGNGLMSALDEICRLSKLTNEDFDYFDKACDLLDTSNSNVLEFLDEFGSDNDDE